MSATRTLCRSAGVWGLGLGVEGARFRVRGGYGLRFRFKGVGLRV